MSDHSASVVPVSRRETADPAPPYITTRGWSLDYLLAELPNSKATAAVHVSDANAVQVINESLNNGLPVVLHGLAQHKNWRSDIFNLKHTQKPRGLGATNVLLRDEKTRTQRESSFAQFVTESAFLTPFRTGSESTRLHAMDVPPPKEWRTWLTPIHHNVMPEFLLPLGPSDLLRHLPSHSRAETTMCYFGVGDTFSPWYKDPCGSIAHNLLVDTNNNGSTFYFIVATRDFDRFSSWLHTLGQEIDQDYSTHFSSLELLKTAPVNIHIVHQQVGSLVIMPPRACYQRIIYRGVNSSIAWSRVTLASLPFALHLELPIYNRTCRSELYRSKLTLFYTVQHYATALDKAYKTGDSMEFHLSVSLDLLELLDEVIINEWAQGVLELPDPELEADMHITCDFCGSDVFITYFECPKCLTGSDDPVAICSLCFASGRTCRCTRRMHPAVARSFRSVLDERNRVAKIIEVARNGEPLPEMSQARIRKSRALQTFRAALQILDARKAAEKCSAPSGSCAPSSGAGHGAPAAHVLTCEECDVSLCFAHALTSPARLHATSAARSFFTDKSSKRSDKEPSWHDVHTLSAEARLEEMQDDIEDTNYHLASTYLAAVANKYHFVVPNDDRSMCTKVGWYDRFADPTGNDRFEQEEAARFQEQVAQTITTRIQAMLSWQHGSSSASVTASSSAPAPRPRDNFIDNGPIPLLPTTESNSEELFDGQAEAIDLPGESSPVPAPAQQESSRSRAHTTPLVSSTHSSQPSGSLKVAKQLPEATERSSEDEALTTARRGESPAIVVASSMTTVKKPTSHRAVETDKSRLAKKRTREEKTSRKEEEIVTARASAQDSRPEKRRRLDSNSRSTAPPNMSKGDAPRTTSSLKTKAKIGSTGSIPVHRGRPSKVQVLPRAAATTESRDGVLSMPRPPGDQAASSSTESPVAPSPEQKLPRLKIHLSAAGIRPSSAMPSSSKRTERRPPASSSKLSNGSLLSTKRSTEVPTELVDLSPETNSTSEQITIPQLADTNRRWPRGDSPLFTDEEWSFRETPSRSSTRSSTPRLETKRTHSPPLRAVLSCGQSGSVARAGTLELCVGAMWLPIVPQTRSIEELYAERVRAVNSQGSERIAPSVDHAFLSSDETEDRPEQAQMDETEFIWRGAQLRPPPYPTTLDEPVEDSPPSDPPDHNSDSAPSASYIAPDVSHPANSPPPDQLDDSLVEPAPTSAPVSSAPSPREYSPNHDLPETLQPPIAHSPSTITRLPTTIPPVHHLAQRVADLEQENARLRERNRHLQADSAPDFEVFRLRERVRELEHDLGVRIDEQQHEFKVAQHEEERRHRAALERLQAAMHEQNLKHAAETRKLRADSDELRNAQARGETERAMISAETRRVQIDQTALRAEIASLRIENVQRNKELVAITKDLSELSKERDDKLAENQKLHDQLEIAHAASAEAVQVVSELRKAHERERAAWSTVGGLAASRDTATTTRPTLVPTPATTPRGAGDPSVSGAHAVAPRVKAEPATIDLSCTSPRPCPDELHTSIHSDSALPAPLPQAAPVVPNLPPTLPQAAAVVQSPVTPMSAVSASGLGQQSTGTGEAPGWIQLPLISSDVSTWGQSVTIQTQQQSSRGRSSSPKHRPSQFRQSHHRRRSRSTERESGRDRNNDHNRDRSRGHRRENERDHSRHYDQHRSYGHQQDRTRERDRDREDYNRDRSDDYHHRARA